MGLQEHDYIGLSEPPTMEISETPTRCLNLRATELRLGLPGYESPERETGHTAKSLVVSGAKRGFSDTINGDFVKWVLGGSEGDLGKNGGLFSPKGVTNGGSESKIPESVKESSKPVVEKKPHGHAVAPASKTQVVGWPPIRSFRKNSMAVTTPKNDDTDDVELSKMSSSCLYVKVSMDGAPYLRKVDLKNYPSYNELSSALGKMFACFTIGQSSSPGDSTRVGANESRTIDLLSGSEYVLTYEDKDGDWMLVGDVPWEMFISSCKRLRIMKSSDASGLAPRAMEKCENRK